MQEIVARSLGLCRFGMVFEREAPRWGNEGGHAPKGLDDLNFPRLLKDL